jgi:hypothetical protein
VSQTAKFSSTLHYGRTFRGLAGDAAARQAPAMPRRILGIAAISGLAAIFAAACGNGGGDSGQDAAMSGDGARGADGTGENDGAGGDGSSTSDSPATGDDGGPVRDGPEEMDGPLCPPCQPKEICCGSTGKCYPAGCMSCCM